MNNVLVSIIVPIYNVEKYLKKCLESLINQSFKQIEIILVNDGSTDQSAEICNQYTKNHSFIKTIHKKNGGLSSARNAGIEISQGKYIMFIDPDDYIESNTVSILYHACEEENCEIACCGKFRETLEGNYVIKNTLKNKMVFSKKEAMHRLLMNNYIDTSACDKIYKSNLFQNIRFPEGQTYEDMATIYKTFLAANKVCHVGIPLYHYVVRDDSITNLEFNSNNFDLLKSAYQRYVDIKNNYVEFSDCARASYLLSITVLINDMERFNVIKTRKKEYLELKHQLFKEKSFVIKNHYLPFIKKLMIILVSIGFSHFVFKLKKVIKKID